VPSRRREGSPAAMWGWARATRGTGVQLASPRVDGRWWPGRGEVRRGRTAAAPTAARGKVARRRGAGQLASALATRGAREASRAAGRRRTQAEWASTERRRAWRSGARGGARRARGGGV
jgi:hypothetical protein